MTSAEATAGGRCATISATRTRRGRYVLEQMPPSAQALRLLGQVVMWRAAFRHRFPGVAAGALAILVGWSFGVLRPKRRRDDGVTGRRPL